MKKIITALALCAVMLGMASCTRGGNIDRGDDGLIGRHGHRHDETAYDTDADLGDRSRDLGEDIYNIPGDVRRGLDDMGDDIRNGMDRAKDDIGNGLDRAGDDVRDGVRDNNMIK